MNPQSIIRRKRDGGALSKAEIEAFVGGVVTHDWTPAQTGSMLMAIFQKGLDLKETSSLLEAMLHSGETLDMEGITCPKVDKHSTGGVGDKVSIVLAPLAASCGLAVPMLSGRGLGHTGGTLDKLESIPGFNVFLSTKAIQKQAREIGCVMAGQTKALVPADRILYAMRDETVTVEHPALIASSILSKKLAEGIDCLLLDVKFGRGAFLKEFDEARMLANLMVDLGRAAGCRVEAWLTRMDTPLGTAIGNAVEVEECIGILKGDVTGELTDLIVDQVAGMVEMTGLTEDSESAHKLVREKLSDGSALERFGDMVRAQGGDPGIIDDPGRLPQAKHTIDILYEEASESHVADIEALAIAGIVLETGAGRRKASDSVDHASGISQLVNQGDPLSPGDVIARLHHNSPDREAEWVDRIRRAVSLSLKPVQPEPRIREKIR
jgi:pyrimidine-nucleoside phosphorylase